MVVAVKGLEPSCRGLLLVLWGHLSQLKPSQQMLPTRQQLQVNGCRVQEVHGQWQHRLQLHKRRRSNSTRQYPSHSTPRRDTSGWLTTPLSRASGNLPSTLALYREYRKAVGRRGIRSWLIADGRDQLRIGLYKVKLEIRSDWLLIFQLQNGAENKPLTYNLGWEKKSDQFFFFSSSNWAFELWCKGVILFSLYNPSWQGRRSTLPSLLPFIKPEMQQSFQGSRSEELIFQMIHMISWEFDPDSSSHLKKTIEKKFSSKRSEADSNLILPAGRQLLIAVSSLLLGTDCKQPAD